MNLNLPEPRISREIAGILGPGFRNLVAKEESTPEISVIMSFHSKPLNQ